MTDYQRGFTDNYAGVRRTPDKSSEWLEGWDAAQAERLTDDREIRKVTVEFQKQDNSAWAR